MNPPEWHPLTTSASSWPRWLNRNGAEGTPVELERVARGLKNATGRQRHELYELRRRTGDGAPAVRKARLLSHAEYCAAEGNLDTPLHGDDPFFDKAAASGRSMGLLNMDWMVRCGYSDAKHPPPTGYLTNEALTSRESSDAREAACLAQQARERRRKLQKTCSKVYEARVVEFVEQGANRK